MKKLLGIVALGLLWCNVGVSNAEAESFKLGVCPEAQLIYMNSSASGFFHKIYKNKSLSKIKKKLKCEPIIVDRDTSNDFYMAIISNRYISQGSAPIPGLFIHEKKFSKLKREYLTLKSKTQIAKKEEKKIKEEKKKLHKKKQIQNQRREKKIAQKKTNSKKKKKSHRAIELEKIEQRFTDGLINVQECRAAKHKFASPSTAVMGCRKTKKLIAQKEQKEKEEKKRIAQKKEDTEERERIEKIKIEEEKKRIAQIKADTEERERIAEKKIEEEKKRIAQKKADAEERERVEKIKIEEEKKRIAQKKADTEERERIAEKKIEEEKKKKGNRSSELEKIEQRFTDGLINVRECRTAKRKFFAADSTAVPGCRKTKKLITQKEQKEKEEKKKLHKKKQIQDQRREKKIAQKKGDTEERIAEKKIEEEKKKKGNRSSELEKIEQRFTDGLINVRECRTAKRKFFASDSTAVPGCRKTKTENQSTVSKNGSEKKENAEAESYKLGICLELGSSDFYHWIYKDKSLSKIKEKLRCDFGDEPIIVDKDTSYDFYMAIISKLSIHMTKNTTKAGPTTHKEDPSVFFIHKTKFSKLKREYLPLKSKTQIAKKTEEKPKLTKKKIAQIKGEKTPGNKREAIEQMYIDDLITKKECIEAKKKTYSSGSGYSSIAIPGCSKTKKLIAQADAEEKPKNNLKTKEDLEAFMIGKEIEMDGVISGKKYTWVTKYDFNGAAYMYSQGMKVEMIWEAVNGNTFKEAMASRTQDGWNTYVLDYDNLTYLATRSKDPYNQGKYFKGNILSPEAFAKKVKKKSVAEKKIEEEKKKIAQKKAKAEERKKLAKLKIEEEKKKIAQIKADAEERERVEKIKIEEEKKRIAQINAEEELENKKLILSNKRKTGTKKIKKKKSNSKNFLEALAKKEVLEDNRKKIIRYECQQPWDLTTEDYRPLLDIYELDLKDRILKGTHRYITDKEYTDERIYPVLASDKDRVLVRYDSPNGNFSTKFFFNYGTDQSIVAADNSYKTQSKCVNRDYFVDIKIDEKKIAEKIIDDKTISKENLKALELAEKEAILAQKEIEEIEKEQKQLLAKQNEILKNQKQKIETAKVVKLKIYDDPKKLTTSLSSSISQSQFYKYNATSVVSYLFFESSENYLISLELLYRAYDQNAEADKIRSHIVYMKESKSSEKNRLKSTRQIVESQSAVIISNIEDEGLKLSEQGKVYYAQSLPYALNAAIATYNLYYAATNTFKNVGASGDIVFGILNNLNNVIGIAQILPQLPAYSKTMYKTTKLIISGAKARKIKDSTNVNKALDELNLET